MDNFNNVFTTSSKRYFFIKNILFCVLKMNKLVLLVWNDIRVMTERFFFYWCINLLRFMHFFKEINTFIH